MRLVMISAAVGALLVLVVSVLLNWGKGGGFDTPAIFEAEPGTCLNWSKPDARDISEVPCSRPYLFEVIGTVDLSKSYGDKAPFPNAEQWQELKQDRCMKVAKRFLRDKFDPHGRFSVGSFTPSAEGWKSGDRTLQCGLQQPGPSGKLYRIQGDVRRADQSNIYETGRCLGINGMAVWDPVDCAEPHSVEVTGQVDLGEQFPGGYPAEPDQDGFLATRCAELTGLYAGGPTVVRDKKLVPYWDTLTEESWDAGSRQVNCKVSAQLPDGSGLAPVTGGVRGDVRVSPQPAPETPSQVRPGVPANEPR